MPIMPCGQGRSPGGQQDGCYMASVSTRFDPLYASLMSIMPRGELRQQEG